MANIVRDVRNPHRPAGPFQLAPFWRIPVEPFFWKSFDRNELIDPFGIVPKMIRDSYEHTGSPLGAQLRAVFSSSSARCHDRCACLESQPDLFYDFITERGIVKQHFGLHNASFNRPECHQVLTSSKSSKRGSFSCVKRHLPVAMASKCAYLIVLDESLMISLDMEYFWRHHRGNWALNMRTASQVALSIPRSNSFTNGPSDRSVRRVQVPDKAPVPFLINR